jgi:hypothetical protein
MKCVRKFVLYDIGLSTVLDWAKFINEQNNFIEIVDWGSNND